MGRKILVIDDDEDILAILGIILEQEGYELELRQTGLSSEEASLLHPDLILLDVRLEGFSKTGTEICAEFKSSKTLSHIPILLVSAEHNLNLLASNCGANGFVNKPFDISGIVNKVKEFIS